MELFALNKEHGAPLHWDAGEARKIATDLKDMEGPLLPILHAFNDRFGCVSDEAIVLIADGYPCRKQLPIVAMCCRYWRMDASFRW